MSVISNGRDRREIPIEFTKDRVLQIQTQCPVLEELAIPVMRDKSSTSETETYKSFGKMESLRSLFITLDCANWQIGGDPTYDAQFDGEDQELAWSERHNVKRGNMREALINSAVDEALARSIWKMIIQNKRSRRLERLKLWTKNGGAFASTACEYSLATAVKSMSRSWLIERLPRHDREHVTVKELGQRARKIHERETGRKLQRVVDQIYHSIWPHKRDSRDWHDNWSSFPLKG